MADQLCGAIRVNTKQVGAIAGVFCLGPAARAVFGQTIRHSPFGSFVRVHKNHLRNNIARLLNADAVPDAHIELVNIGLVMEGGPLYGRPGQNNRLQDGQGGNSSRAADLRLDIKDLGIFLFRRVFIRQSPARVFHRFAHALSYAH